MWFSFNCHGRGDVTVAQVASHNRNPLRSTADGQQLLTPTLHIPSEPQGHIKLHDWLPSNRKVYWALHTPSGLAAMWLKCVGLDKRRAFRITHTILESYCGNFCIIWTCVSVSHYSMIDICHIRASTATRIYKIKKNEKNTMYCPNISSSSVTIRSRKHLTERSGTTSSRYAHQSRISLQ